jgi:hypothetical protein
MRGSRRPRPLGSTSAAELKYPLRRRRTARAIVRGGARRRAVHRRASKRRYGRPRPACGLAQPTRTALRVGLATQPRGQPAMGRVPWYRAAHLALEHHSLVSLAAPRFRHSRMGPDWRFRHVQTTSRIRSSGPRHQRRRRARMPARLCPACSPVPCRPARWRAGGPEARRCDELLEALMSEVLQITLRYLPGHRR